MAFPEQQKQEEQVKRGNGPGVGALLKASRLRIGDDLSDISEVLCIRNVYLEAIEDGRFEELPGPTYATGFIRAYAEYLGLDSDEVVRRFKADPSGGEGKSELIFPEPIPEPGIPGGAVVFIGIVIAVVAYGAWYVNSSKEGFLVELISPVPERLAALAPNRQEPAADSGTPAKETAGDTAGDTAMPAGGKPSAEAAPMPEPAATMPASEAPSEAPTTAGEAAPESEAATGTAPVLEAGPEAPSTTESTAETTVATPPVLEAGPEAPTAAVGEAEPEAPTAAATPDPQEAAWASVARAVRASAAGEAAAEAQTTAAAEPAPHTETAPVGEAAPDAQTAPGPASSAAAASQEPAAEPAATVEAPTAPGNIPEDVIPESQPSAQPPAERAAATPEPASTRASETAPATAPETPTVSEAASPGGASGAEQAAAPSAAPSASGGGDESRIVVRAKTNSWIQIRDDIGQELLVTRLLRAGDSYAVPNRRGLKLSTGNAGALEILVDGKVVPSIGDEGIVRRGVALDADKLKAGTAVGE